jgi:hypothetical protein
MVAAAVKEKRFDDKAVGVKYNCFDLSEFRGL